MIIRVRVKGHWQDGHLRLPAVPSTVQIRDFTRPRCGRRHAMHMHSTVYAVRLVCILAARCLLQNMDVAQGQRRP